MGFWVHAFVTGVCTLVPVFGSGMVSLRLHTEFWANPTCCRAAEHWNSVRGCPRCRARTVCRRTESRPPAQASPIGGSQIDLRGDALGTLGSQPVSSLVGLHVPVDQPSHAPCIATPCADLATSLRNGLFLGGSSSAVSQAPQLGGGEDGPTSANRGSAERQQSHSSRDP